MSSEPRPSARELRDTLRERLAEWEAVQGPIARRELSPTYNLGFGMKCVAFLSTLIRQAVDTLLPAVALGERPTFGRLVGALDKFGQREPLPGHPKRKLVIRSEIEVLNRLTRIRAAMAHPEDQERSLEMLGRLSEDQLREYISLSRRVLDFPLLDELVRVQEMSPGDLPV